MTEFKLDQPAYKEKLQEPRYSHVQQLYAIFRVGKKFTDMKSIEHFQKHMQRLVDVPNARKGNVVNEVLIGSEHVAQLVAEYLKGVNIHKNNVIARELLLTASPQFFRGLPDKELEMWKDENIRFLKDKFGSNCVYAVLHKDETTWHIHALIVPKFYNEQENKYFLSNKRYFDGPEKLREWQDKYADAMHTVFPSLCRGVRYSKAKHIEIRHFYAMVNSELDEQNIKQVCAKAKNSELLEVKVKALQKTLSSYKEIGSKTAVELKQMRDTIWKLKKDAETYKQVVDILSKEYKIPKKSIEQVVDNVQNKVNESDVLERVK